ncbi:MAG TPA: patatin-like phospholipase family protein [Stellaceae bacterium]|jgi:NTE family protein
MRATSLRTLLLGGLGLLAAGCAAPVVPVELPQISQTAGYRYGTLDRQAPKGLAQTAVLLSFSGGGTRAAALSDGALRALAETTVPTPVGPVPLASQIDVISSVSGGSVTAAKFALDGIPGLDGFERGFLHADAQGSMIAGALLNPTKLVAPRIGILQSYLDDNVFDHHTYADLIARDQPGAGRRPYIILNATDMANGSQFSFTQDQFDLICGDLAPLRVADAVSASAAFPVALSALTLRNHAPCPAQDAAAASAKTGWESDDGRPVPSRVLDDHTAKALQGVNYPSAQNLARFRRGTEALTYLNRYGKKDYVQLLDGGLADNVGLTVPLILLTSGSLSPSIQSWVNTGTVSNLLFVVVNARSQDDNSYGSSPSPPGIVDTLLTTIGAPIDANSFQLVDQLTAAFDQRLKQDAIVMVDFDFIKDFRCREHFHNIATSWALPGPQVDELIALGRAMVLQAPRYQALVHALGGTAPPPGPTVDDICAPYASRPVAAVR